MIDLLSYLDKLAGKWLDWRTDQAIKSLPPELQEFKLHKAEINTTEWEITALAPGIVAMADEAAELLSSQGAKNYLQFDLMPRLDRGKPPIRVTVQWAHGESPAKQNARLRDQIEQVEKELARMLQAVYPSINLLSSLSGLLSQVDLGLVVPMIEADRRLSYHLSHFQNPEPENKEENPCQN